MTYKVVYVHFHVHVYIYTSVCIPDKKRNDDILPFTWFSSSLISQIQNDLNIMRKFTFWVFEYLSFTRVQNKYIIATGEHVLT